VTDLLTRFESAYQEAVAYLEPYVRNTKLQKMVAELDCSMHPDHYDMKNYLLRSLIRFRFVVEQLGTLTPDQCDSRTWLEVGCLYPALPIALAKVGFHVSVAENYSFYPDEFIAMYRRVQKDFGIRFLDMDFSSPRTKVPAKYNNFFDTVSCLAVLEHLPYTPKFMLQNIHRSLNNHGRLFCEVPNFFYWNSVLKFFSGQHLQQPMEIVYHSGVPFVGHHREYSLADLKYVLRESGFDDLTVARFNYSIGSPLDMKVALFHWPALLFEGLKETILVTARKSRIPHASKAKF